LSWHAGLNELVSDFRALLQCSTAVMYKKLWIDPTMDNEGIRNPLKINSFYGFRISLS